MKANWLALWISTKRMGVSTIFVIFKLHQNVLEQYLDQNIILSLCLKPDLWLMTANKLAHSIFLPSLLHNKIPLCLLPLHFLFVRDDEYWNCMLSNSNSSLLQHLQGMWYLVQENSTAFKPNKQMNKIFIDDKMYLLDKTKTYLIQNH